MGPISPSESLAEAVDGMLEAVVVGALGPSPKRKLPEHRAGEQGEEAVALHGPQADVVEAKAPGAKWAKLQPTTEAAAPATVEPMALPISATPTGSAPSNTVLEPQLDPASISEEPAVDLEAAIGELLGDSSGDELPSTQPLCATQPTADVAEAADPVDLLGGDASPQAPAPTSVLRAVEQGQLVVELDVEQGQLVVELDVELMQPISGGADGMATNGATPTTCSSAAVAAAPSISPATLTLAHLLPPTTNPADPPPPSPVLVASGAAATACPPDTAVAHHHHFGGRLAAQSLPHPCPPTTAASPWVINMLKGDIKQDFDAEEEHSDTMDDEFSFHSGSLGDLHSPGTGGLGPATPLERIGQYELRGKKAGSGGLGVVYPALHQPSGRSVALKLGSAFAQEEGAHDFSWTTFTTEWNTYATLAGKALPWVAQAFEYGLVKLDSGVAPWITLSLLGPSLHDLNQRGAVAPALFGYARGMLAALEGLHAQGFIHNDVKPANFCVAASCDAQAVASAALVAALAPGGGLGAGAAAVQLQQQTLPIFLIDFGFAFRSDPAAAGSPMDFVGTPDFASSAALLGKRPGRCDDLEALGYSLLDLAIKELPWEITKHSDVYDAKGQPRDISYWTAQQLTSMEQRREAKWRSLVQDGGVPGWLVHWVDYCRGLPASAAPDYDRLRGFITFGEHEAAKAGATKATAASEAWAWPEE